jgi:hypothetical protein
MCVSLQFFSMASDFLVSLEIEKKSKGACDFLWTLAMARI